MTEKSNWKKLLRDAAAHIELVGLNRRNYFHYDMSLGSLSRNAAPCCTLGALIVAATPDNEAVRTPGQVALTRAGDAYLAACSHLGKCLFAIGEPSISAWSDHSPQSEVVRVLRVCGEDS